MKKMLLGLLLFSGATFVLAQEPPAAVVLPIPDATAALIVTILASGATWYKVIDGLKNMIPWIKNNPAILKWVNLVGNFVTIAGGCIAVGHINGAFDVAKCFFAAAAASLVAAGFYEAKKASDLARAGGAAPLVNIKAVAETQKAGETK